ncbi:pilus Caulobacter type biogenesis lipoprotein CpaD family protein [Asticcacaulis biprosthecium C19]|uniref:Pilus Caulobacter type biogenesis lipoprotein CpaD family protein n=2 Tax=Asticcacaulis biprosthecium TaxID=76891 RepID=F4QJ55_9CAUL|nr:pilus Caulobacter type biogenesis lipoprotein CpaD family protein [Asticcacaulis biprosthecium C19]
MALVALLAASALTACATGNQARLEPAPAVTPTAQFALTAESRVEPIHLRINPTGISANQARALDQVASQAAWTAGQPVDVQIITSPDPASMAAGNAIAGYLAGRDVSRDAVSQFSVQSQPVEIVTVNVVSYRASVPGCGQTWENLAATRKNTPHANFGCAITANLAAQVADPRDLVDPATATPSDAGRKSVVLDKYRRGEVTSAAKDEQSTGAISQAIK